MQVMSNCERVDIGHTTQYLNRNRIQYHNQVMLNNHNFSLSMANSQEDDDISNQRKKPSSRDPLSHRIIEKRRRDRMNNCLADLSRLIPSVYLKKGRGRIEKTEIIEMAIKHMKHLQAHTFCSNDTNCELSDTTDHAPHAPHAPHALNGERLRQYRLGYQECLSEAVRFLVEMEGLFTGDGLCRRMMDHLQHHGLTLHNGRDCNEQQMDVSIDSAMGMSMDAAIDASMGAGVTNNWSPSSPPLSESSCLEKSGEPSLVTSHLREMLESAPKQRNTHSRHTYHSSSPQSDPYRLNQSEVYKFKKDIKDRFQADQKVLEPSISGRIVGNSVDDERISNSSLSSMRSDTSGYSSRSSFSRKSPTEPKVVVPVFALHPSGNYYMPLTLDTSIVGSLVNQQVEHNWYEDLNAELNSELHSELNPVLHPISIAVNFNYQIRSLNFRNNSIAPNLGLISAQSPSYSHSTAVDSKFDINLKAAKKESKFKPI